jgi:hypothetical protein
VSVVLAEEKGELERGRLAIRRHQFTSFEQELLHHFFELQTGQIAIACLRLVTFLSSGDVDRFQGVRSIRFPTRNSINVTENKNAKPRRIW